ncbi:MULTISPECIES: hypothetical protein [Kribbella]|uniref:hypothetical protein n=1 Tax=Kribbella TaxID=182639 RepID=UPI001047E73B|nr:MULTISPECIES: hypothetical protein [Kribbella]
MLLAVQRRARAGRDPVEHTANSRCAGAVPPTRCSSWSSRTADGTRLPSSQSDPDRPLVGPACSVDFGTRVASQYGETARQQRDSAPAGGVLLQ